MRRMSSYQRIKGKDLEKLLKKGITEEAAQRFTAERYDVKSKVKEVVETMYFPEGEGESVESYLKKLSKEKIGEGTSGSSL